MIIPASVLLAVLHLVVLHTVDGHEVAVSPDQVTSLHARTNEPNKFFADSVNCIVGLTDGKIISTSEKCDEVKQRLEDAK